MRSAKIAWPYFQRIASFSVSINLFTFGEHFWVQNTPCNPFQQCFHESSGKAPPSENLLPERSPRFKSFDEILCSTLRKNHKFCPGGSESRSILDLIWPFGSATDQDLSRWARFQVSFVAKSSENEFPMSECRNFSLHPCSGALPGSHKGQNYLQVEDV